MTSATQHFERNGKPHNSLSYNVFVLKRSRAGFRPRTCCAHICARARRAACRGNQAALDTPDTARKQHHDRIEYNVLATGVLCEHQMRDRYRCCLPSFARHGHNKTACCALATAKPDTRQRKQCQDSLESAAQPRLHFRQGQCALPAKRTAQVRPCTTC